MRVGERLLASVNVVLLVAALGGCEKIQGGPDRGAPTPSASSRLLDDVPASTRRRDSHLTPSRSQSGPPWISSQPLGSGPALSAKTVYRVEDMANVSDTGEVWFRTTVDLRTIPRAPGHPFGIYYGGLASHEIFWDGVRIGGGGVVGRTKAEEVPGPIEAHYAIPDRLATPGVHTLEMRASAFHRGFRPLRGYWQLLVGDYDRIVKGGPGARGWRWSR